MENNKYTVVLIKEKVGMWDKNTPKHLDCFKVLSTFDTLELAKLYQQSKPNHITIIIPTY